jgi:predicted nuclease of predicted toxin-antitoxin system
MRLVVDQGMPRDVAAGLRALDFDCVHLAGVGRSESTDPEVLQFSLAQEATIVTLDADFHTILAVSGAGGPSVIRFRPQGIRAPDVVSLVPLARFWRKSPYSPAAPLFNHLSHFQPVEAAWPSEIVPIWPD